MRCMACGTPGAYWCESCDIDYKQALSDVRGVIALMGSEYDEGSLVLTAHRLLRDSAALGLTSIGRTDILFRSRELLASVEDYFLQTPTCLVCKVHKMIIIPAPQPEVTCTGGCAYG